MNNSNTIITDIAAVPINNNTNTAVITVTNPRLTAFSRDFLGGIFCGCTSLITSHPFDTIRVRLQTATNQIPTTIINGVINSSNITTNSAAHSTTIIGCIRSTYRNEGLLAFYKGLSVPLFCSGLSKSIMFSVFGFTKRTLTNITNNNSTANSINNQPNILITAVSGGTAGLINSLLTSPIELIRSKLQVQYHRFHSDAIYKSPLHLIKSIYSQSNSNNNSIIKSFWLGCTSQLLRDIPGLATYYTVFECMKYKLIQYRINNNTNINNSSLATISELSIAGGLSGLSFWIAAFPQDTIKTNIQTQSSTALRAINSTSFFSVGRQIISESGFIRLYRGFPIAFFRGIPGASVTFISYEWAVRTMFNNGW